MKFQVIGKLPFENKFCCTNSLFFCCKRQTEELIPYRYLICAVDFSQRIEHMNEFENKWFNTNIFFLYSFLCYHIYISIKHTSKSLLARAAVGWCCAKLIPESPLAVMVGEVSSSCVPSVTT